MQNGKNSRNGHPVIVFMSLFLGKNRGAAHQETGLRLHKPASYRIRAFPALKDRGDIGTE
tara:strand:- start:465 stop:644 length:180 start_codon:yes stop_codon:yes gene_type:complete